MINGNYKIVMAACITGCIFFCSCENDKKEIDNLTVKKLGIEEAKDISINYTMGGKPKATLLSPLMLRVQDTVTYVEFPKRLHVDFYNDTAGVDSRLDAMYGKYYENESKIFLKDSVRVINVLGDTLHCEELWWDRNRIGSEFYTNKPVKIRRKMHIIDGIGMEARQDFKEWHIIESKGFIKVPASQFPAE